MTEAISTASMKAEALANAPKPARYEGPNQNQVACHVFATTERNQTPIYLWRLNGVECPEERAAHWLAVWQDLPTADDRAETLTMAARGVFLDEMDRLAKTIPFAELQADQCVTPRMAVYLTLQWVLDPMRKPDPMIFLARR